MAKVYGVKDATKEKVRRFIDRRRRRRPVVRKKAKSKEFAKV